MSIGLHVGRELIAKLGVKTYAEAALELAKTHNSHCSQIFIMNPNSTAWVDVGDDLVGALRDHSPPRIYAHSNYLSHMCKPTSIGVIHMQIKRATHLGLSGLVVHLENAELAHNVRAAAGLLAFADSDEARLVGAHQHARLKLIFEINAITPKTGPIFHQPEVCKAFVRELHKLGFGHAAFGICLDTAHLWTSGLNVRFSSALSHWLREFGDPAWIALFHLNDSKSELGGPDAHDTIGHGKIWPISKDGKKSLKYENLPRHPGIALEQEPGFIEIARFAKRHKIDIILERGKATPEMAIEELDEMVKLGHYLRT